MTPYIENLTADQVQSWGALLSDGKVVRSYTLSTAILVEYESVKTYDFSKRMKKSVVELINSITRYEEIKKEVSESGKYGKITILSEGERIVVELITDYKGDYGRTNYYYGEELIEFCNNVIMSENQAIEKQDWIEQEMAEQFIVEE